MNTNEYSSVDKYLNKIKKFLVLLSLQSTSNERRFCLGFCHSVEKFETNYSKGRGVFSELNLLWLLAIFRVPFEQ